MTKKVSKHISSYFDQPLGKWPAAVKKRIAGYCDELWALAVRSDWNNRCAVCGATASLEAHHMYPRQHMATRYSVSNGICLCTYCHVYCPKYSPHQNGGGFTQWLLCHYPFAWQWYMDTVDDPPEFTGVKDLQYYFDVLRDLRQYVDESEYVRIVGVRFAAWLEETE